MDVGYREVVLRSRPAQVLVVLVVAICVVTEGFLVAYGDGVLLLRATGPLALVAVGGWALFWRPAVRVGPAEVELINPLRSVRVTWPAITDVETRWSLVLVTVHGRFTAWAAPRSGALAHARTARQDMQRRAVGGSDQRRTGAVRDDGAAAPELVLHRWEAYRDDGLLGVVEGSGVETAWHLWTATVLGLLLVATVAGALTP